MIAKTMTKTICPLALLLLMAGAAMADDIWYQCKYCGHKARDVGSLTGSACQRHPDGPGKGRHAL